MAKAFKDPTEVHRAGDAASGSIFQRSDVDVLSATKNEQQTTQPAAKQPPAEPATKSPTWRKK